MSDYIETTRLLVAKREDEDSPMVVGAMPNSTWGLIPPEDWDQWKRETAEKFFDADWTAYDYIEVLITIPCSDLLAMFTAREIAPTSIKKAEDQ